MTELVGQHLDEDKIWLSRYKSLKDLKYWFEKDKLKINFSSIEKFDDVLEGLNTDDPSFKKVYLMAVSYVRRVKRDGGFIEGMKHLLTQLYLLDRNSLSNSNLEARNKLEKIIKEYLELIESNFASCWFISDSPDHEERYMWNIYGQSREENAFMISIKWTDLKKELEKSKKNFTYGMVDYEGKNTLNPLYNKDSSYAHEKEFRILTEGYKNDNTQGWGYFEFENEIPYLIKFSDPLSAIDQNIEKDYLNLSDTRAKISQLPIQYEIGLIKALLDVKIQ
jgi:hypothetical protein